MTYIPNKRTSHYTSNPPSVGLQRFDFTYYIMIPVWQRDSR